MAYVILGLLMWQPMSLYDLLRAFEAGISMFYVSSAGSMKRALDGLLKRGEIEIAAEEPTGRRRKTYAITDAGRAAFRDWMLTAPIGADLDTEALPRIYFLGFLEPADRPLVLDRIQARIVADIGALEALTEMTNAQPIPEELADVARFGQSIIDYGLRSHRVALEWIDELRATV